MRNKRSFGFVKESKPTARREDSFESKCAGLLANAIQKYQPHKRKFQLAKWKDEFSKLTNEVSQETISRILDWYISHIGEEFVPEAFSGKSFRIKFHQLLKLANEDYRSIQ